MNSGCELQSSGILAEMMGLVSKRRIAVRFYLFPQNFSDGRKKLGELNLVPNRSLGRT